MIRTVADLTHNDVGREFIIAGFRWCPTHIQHSRSRVRLVGDWTDGSAWETDGRRFTGWKGDRSFPLDEKCRRVRWWRRAPDWVQLDEGGKP